MSTEALRRHSKGPLRCVDNQVTHVNTRKVSKTSAAEQLRLAKGFGKHSSVLLPGSLIPFPFIISSLRELVILSTQASTGKCTLMLWKNYGVLEHCFLADKFLELLDRVTLAKTNEWISKLFKPPIVFTFLLVYISESRCYCSLYEEYSLWFFCVFLKGVFAFSSLLFFSLSQFDSTSIVLISWNFREEKPPVVPFN